MEESRDSFHEERIISMIRESKIKTFTEFLTEQPEYLNVSKRFRGHSDWGGWMYCGSLLIVAIYYNKLILLEK